MTASPLIINALVTQVGANMGDHAQDITTAVIVDPDETVAQLVERLLMRYGWVRPDGDNPGHRQDEPDPAKFLTLRLAVPGIER